MKPIITRAVISIYAAITWHVPIAAAEEVRAGLVIALTGPVAQHGTAALVGLKLGLAAGKCEERVKLFVEDDGYDPKRSLSAARKLDTADKVQVLLGAGSGPCHAVAPYAEQNQIPFFALAGDSKVSRGRKYTIRLRPTATYEGQVLARLARREAADKVVILCHANDFTLNVCDSAQQELGKTVVYREDILPEETDFRSLLTKTRTFEPSHIMPILLPGKLAMFAKQARESGVKAPFLGGVFFESTEDVAAAGGALEGAKFVTATVSDEFKKLYASADSASPGSIAWAAVFYDVGIMLCEAGKGGEDLLKFVQNYSASRGAVEQMQFRNGDGDQYLDYVFVDKRIVDDKFEVVPR